MNNIKKIAFEKESIIFLILIIFLLATVRWYILEKEKSISYDMATVFLKKTINEFKTNNDLPSSKEESYVKFYHLTDVEKLIEIGYSPELVRELKETLPYDKELIEKIKLKDKYFLDWISYDKSPSDNKDIRMIRVDVNSLNYLVYGKFLDIFNLILVIGGIIYLIFLYINGQLRANNIENNERRLRLDKINKELREQQDEVLKHQTELVSANERYEVVNQQLRGYANDLEKNKTAMLNMLQDIDDARKEADRANNAKSVFLASMSHEIRTPMNGVLGMIDICLSTNLNDEQKDYLETAHSSGIALMSLLNDILDFSKVEAGKLEIENAEFDPYHMLRDVVFLFRQKVYEKRIELLVQIDANIPKLIIGDSTRIRQILSNLVGNSVKFTEKGYILVRAYVKSELQGNFLQIDVMDTGMGMTPGQYENLFKPFMQADASISRKYGGTGLGLTISKQLVNLMNGKLLVVSEEEKGSTFSVQLPLQSASESGFLILPEISKKSFLLIISNKIVLENIIAYFNQLGARYHCIDTCHDLDEIEPSQWDGCLFDPQIMDLDNYLKMFSKIKKVNEKFRIIGLCNYSQHTILEKLKSKITIEPLYKPALLESLQDALIGTSKKETGRRFEGMADKIDKNISILVAEDNAVNQKVIKSYFDKLGFKNVLIVSNGQEALEAIKNNKINIVFMDIQMPVMDGLRATMKIRENEKNEGKGDRLPVIALTAHSYVGEQKRCFDAGVDDCLGKPIQLDRLISCLEKWSQYRTLLLDEAQSLAQAAPVKPLGDQASALRSEIDINYDFFNLTKETLGESFSEVIDLFIEDCIEKIKEIDLAFLENDRKSISTYAHQLKSSSGNFGITKLSEFSKDLENCVNRDPYSYDEARDIYSKIISEFNKAKTFLYKQISRHDE